MTAPQNNPIATNPMQPATPAQAASQPSPMMVNNQVAAPAVDINPMSMPQQAAEQPIAQPIPAEPQVPALSDIPMVSAPPQASESDLPPKEKSMTGILLVIVLLLGAVAGFLYWRNQQAVNDSANQVQPTVTPSVLVTLEVSPSATVTTTIVTTTTPIVTATTDVSITPTVAPSNSGL